VIPDLKQNDLFSELGHIACLVKTEAFEGPLDLLLHLIKKNEVDIYNIPMAEITRQYLDYVEVMRELNLDVAGEFLLMASTLIQIKSKMLLPPDPSENTDEEMVEDPRAELVRRLLEYQKYKEVSQQLVNNELLERDVFARKFTAQEISELPDEELPIDLDLSELVDAFRSILSKAPREAFHEVGSENISIADRINDILDYLRLKDTVSFEELFLGSVSREFIVATFLSILELCRLKMIRITQVDGFGPIWIKPSITESLVTEEMVDSFRS